MHLVLQTFESLTFHYRLVHILRLEQLYLVFRLTARSRQIYLRVLRVLDVLAILIVSVIIHSAAAKLK